MSVLVKGMEMPETCSDYIKRSNLAAIISDLLVSPWANRRMSNVALGIREALCLVQDIVNDEVQNDALKLPAADVVEVVRCKDCKHRPYSTEPGKTYGLTIEAPDGRCPCHNEDDGWYSWVPDNEFFCFYGERKEVEE